MRRILLSTDGSGHAVGASKYLAYLYRGASDVEITVLHVSPPVPPIYRDERHDPEIREVYRAWKKAKEEEAERYLEESVQVLVKEGITKSRIKEKPIQQAVGVARDILREMDAEQYDACVIGKKGMGWFDEVFLGSISSKLLEISENHPIWLVSGNRGNSRKILVSMDYTVQAVQIARYVGKMLQGLEGVTLCFFHYYTPWIEKLSPEERKKMKDMEKRTVARQKDQMLQLFSEAQQVLEDFGFDGKTIEHKFLQGNSASPRVVSREILEQVRKGKFGTLVIGRKGATGAREFRLGSTAWRIVTESENCAVWVV